MENNLTRNIDAFVCLNGAQFNSVRDLTLALEDMEERVFKHHVDENKNDFAKWISEAAEDEELATTIERIKDQKQMMFLLMKNIILRL